MRRVLITGGGGFLGSGLLGRVPPAFEAVGTRRSSGPGGSGAPGVELSDRRAVDHLWDSLRPDLVIHTAYSMEAGARDIVAATRNVADACADWGAELIHLSTDLVLDGERAPYAEDADPAPIHQYGRWKAEAELYVRERLPGAAVVRTSLITSFDPLDPRTAWVADGLRGQSPLTLYVDEIRCPIGREDLSRQIWEIAALPAAARAGVWHLAGPEAMSRYALGVLIAAALGLPADRIVPAWSATASERRPRDLRLLTGRADAALATRARPVAALASERVATRHASG